MYARRLSRATLAAAAAHAGIKMSKKFNTKSTNHGGLRKRPAIINQIHEQWCLDNGYASNEQLHQENTNRFVESASNKQSTSEQTSKHRGPTSTVNGQASKALVQQTSKHGPWNKFQALVTEVLD